jgi:hypothetical protein
VPSHRDRLIVTSSSTIAIAARDTRPCRHF